MTEILKIVNFINLSKVSVFGYSSLSKRNEFLNKISYLKIKLTENWESAIRDFKIDLIFNTQKNFEYIVIDTINLTPFTLKNSLKKIINYANSNNAKIIITTTIYRRLEYNNLSFSNSIKSELLYFCDFAFISSEIGFNIIKNRHGSESKIEYITQNQVF